LIRHGGHNQGGGGEQNAETWTYDLDRDVWMLKQPNDAPPGVCCAQQNVFHDAAGRFVRFPAFSASHGWQSIREVSLKNSSVWTYDPAADRWANLMPLPEPSPKPLRGAAYDPLSELIVLHGGEGASHSTCLYDLYTNTWHRRRPKDAPPETSQQGFAFDTVNRVAVLFGSQFETDSRTWLYDLAKNEWRVLATEIHPPANKSCPVLAADTRNGIVLCSVTDAKTLETWALDVAKARWTRLDVKFEGGSFSDSAAGTRNRLLTYLPDRNLFVQEIRDKTEQQIWTFRLAEAESPRPPPRELRAVVHPERRGVQLAWKPPAGAGDVRYNVYRGTSAEPWNVKFELIAKEITKTLYEDRELALPTGPRKAEGAQSDQPLDYYRVHAVSADGRERAGSFLARVQPPIVTDVVVSLKSSKEAVITWPRSPAGDVVGYHIERAEVSVYSTEQVKNIRDRLRAAASDLSVGRIRQIGAFKPLTTKPVAELSFADTSLDLESGQREVIQKETSDAPLYRRELPKGEHDATGKPYRLAVYAYRVRAVNRAGITGGPSPAAFTFPSAVQHVFAKEEGTTTTHLRWKANPEVGIAGYLVYRHNGRFQQSPIVRVTPGPIRETAASDETAGKDTRRYEIVAVDALGQEGAPSQPVWSRREWQQFYVPYAKEWHQ
jgi:hypothetical protein